MYISAQNFLDVKKLEEKIKEKVLKEVNIIESSTYLSNARQIEKLNLQNRVILILILHYIH